MCLSLIHIFNSIVDGAVVTVNCTNSEVAHADSSYALLNGSFTVGDVQGDASNGYTVGVTVAPDAYVTAYNTEDVYKRQV